MAKVHTKKNEYNECAIWMYSALELAKKELFKPHVLDEIEVRDRQSFSWVKRSGSQHHG